MSVLSEVTRLQNVIAQQANLIEAAKTTLESKSTPSNTEDLDAILTEQETLIATLQEILKGKGAGSTDTEDAIVERLITEYSNSRVTYVGSGTFYCATNLVTASFPNATRINANGFNYCTALTEISVPLATYLGNYAFRDCLSLVTVEFPKVTSIGTRVFYGSYNLTKIDFAVPLNVNTETFYNCTSLKALILRGTAGVSPLSNTNAFTNTPIASGTGYIYVHKTLDDGSDGVAVYQAATNWATFPDQIRAIEDYPDICDQTYILNGTWAMNSSIDLSAYAGKSWGSVEFTMNGSPCTGFNITSTASGITTNFSGAEDAPIYDTADGWLYTTLYFAQELVPEWLYTLITENGTKQ